ncbi:MAG: GTP-binding protein [Candidatus Moeniiplasma glomeromycotorum]|nr:GTP-binding protein [Candidatus Moeniiplasma glomeromycotorum]MCE8167083.1 GTP-binding protein [Candidatus Moeniiplasma glomeromycotorum]MCE8168905.1 GTP-binding protein [Candidatus Moeniiplasma glomeromycotorum]
MFRPKKNETNNHLLVELLRKETVQVTSKFKDNCLWLAEEESIAPEELGKLIGQPTVKIIAFFWDKKIFVNQNQNLTPDLLNDYCTNFKLQIKPQKTLEFSVVIQKYLEKVTNHETLVKRPPVVSVMGHIDHGKTTLLDTINQTSQQKKEAGGITQKVTTSQAEFKDQKITFLDTPGHSTFVKMRQRGISLTDLVVLVIEAGEGIMFQTVEIINYLRKYKLPSIVFINHKNPAKTNQPVNLHKIDAQLTEKELNPLAVINGNAKKSQDPGINELLENIVSLSDFRSPLQVPAHGVVIDSYFDSHTKHWVNELLIQGGELVEKDTLFLNGQFARVKTGTIHDMFTQKTVQRASPGNLVKIFDLNISAELGERFLVVNDKEIEENIQQELKNYWEKRNKLSSTLANQEKKNFNLTLIANSENARLVLHDLVKKKEFSTVNLTIVSEIIGNLTSSDLELIKSTNSMVLLFSKINSAQKKVFQTNNIPFFSSQIIYEIEKELDKIIGQQQVKEKATEEIGTAQVKKVFSFSGGNIAGFRVMKGKIKRNSLVQVWRVQQKIFTGEIKSLESNKAKLNEISSGQEGGMMLKNFNDWQEGDQIVAFQISKIDKKLSSSQTRISQD